MTALAADAIYRRRGPAIVRNEFAYSLAAGEKCFRGSHLATNAAGNLVRVQTAGSVTYQGIADRTLDNTGSAAVSVDKVTPMKGTWVIPVPGATVANIGATVYATDDGTLTLTQSGSLLTVGVLRGFDGGLTCIDIVGS